MSLLLTVVEYDGEVYGLVGERSTDLPDGCDFLGWEYSREPLESINLPTVWANFVRPISDLFVPNPPHLDRGTADT
jgi:hypothetical protein